MKTHHTAKISLFVLIISLLLGCGGGGGSSQSGSSEWLVQAEVQEIDVIAGTAVVVLERSGGNGDMELRFSTSNDSAFAGKDYQAHEGQKNWKADDANRKTINIDLLEHPLPRNSRRFFFEWQGVLNASEISRKIPVELPPDAMPDTRIVATGVVHEDVFISEKVENLVDDIVSYDAENAVLRVSRDAEWVDDLEVSQILALAPSVVLPNGLLVRVGSIDQDGDGEWELHVSAAFLDEAFSDLQLDLLGDGSLLNDPSVDWSVGLESGVGVEVVDAKNIDWSLRDEAQLASLQAVFMESDSDEEDGDSLDIDLMGEILRVSLQTQLLGVDVDGLALIRLDPAMSLNLSDREYAAGLSGRVVSSLTLTTSDSFEGSYTYHLFGENGKALKTFLVWVGGVPVSITPVVLLDFTIEAEANLDMTLADMHLGGRIDVGMSYNNQEWDSWNNNDIASAGFSGFEVTKADARIHGYVTPQLRLIAYQHAGVDASLSLGMQLSANYPENPRLELTAPFAIDLGARARWLSSQDWSEKSFNPLYERSFNIWSIGHPEFVIENLDGYLAPITWDSVPALIGFSLIERLGSPAPTLQWGLTQDNLSQGPAVAVQDIEGGEDQWIVAFDPAGLGTWKLEWYALDTLSGEVKSGVYVVEVEGDPGEIFVPASVTVYRGEASLFIDVRREGGSDTSASVAWEVMGDWVQPANGVIHWQDGDDTTQTIEIAITYEGEDAAESPAMLQLSDPQGATLGNDRCEITMQDIPPAVISFTNDALVVSRAEGEARITVQRSGGSDAAVSVQWHAEEDTATSADAELPQSGILSWPAGDEDDQVITIALHPAIESVPDRQFVITLSNPDGAVLGDESTVVVTIEGEDVGGGFSMVGTWDGSIPNDGETFVLRIDRHDEDGSIAGYFEDDYVEGPFAGTVDTAAGTLVGEVTVSTPDGNGRVVMNGVQGENVGSGNYWIYEPGGSLDDQGSYIIQRR